MMNRVVTVAVLIPLAVVLVALAVANRAPVAFTLDPFNPGNPGLTVNLPLFIYVFAAMAIGLILGSFATWMRQGYYRKLARKREAELSEARKAAPASTSTAVARPTI